MPRYSWERILAGLPFYELPCLFLITRHLIYSFPGVYVSKNRKRGQTGAASVSSGRDWKSPDESDMSPAVSTVHIPPTLQCHFQGIITQVVLISMRSNYAGFPTQMGGCDGG